MELLSYLLKVSACSALFFAFYLLVLRRLTFFKINRFYLLSSLLLSFVIPAFHFNLERQVEAPQLSEVVAPSRSQLEMAPVFDGPTTTAPIGNPEKESFDWLALLPYCYGLIVIALLCLAGWRLFQLLKHARKNTQEVNGLKLVSKSIGFTNCSFFKYVFVDENSLTENELQVLLMHEKVHARQFHSIDKVILILAKAVLWLNPVVYLYDKALEQTHEFEADEATSQSFGTELYANLLLRLAIAKSEMPLVHNFVKSPIKERIKMLFNSKSKDMKKLIYLLALPIGLGLLWGFTVDVVEVSNNKYEVNAFPDEITQPDTSAMAKIDKKVLPLLNKIVEGKVLGFGNEIPSLPTIEILSNGLTYPINNPFANNKNFKLLPPSIRVGDIVKVKIGKSYVISPKFDHFVIIPEKVFGPKGNEIYTRPAQKIENKKLPKVGQDSLWNKPIRGKVKSILQTEVGEILNFKHGENIVEIFNSAKGKVKVGDELWVTIGGTIQDIRITDSKGNVIRKLDKPCYSMSKLATIDGKILFEMNSSAFSFEVNKARSANSKIKAIQKNKDGTINTIVLNDKSFTINLKVADQKFRTNNFKVGDSVLVKFIGEKLISKNTYSTDKMIVLYSWPKKYELKNEKLFDKFYTKDGRQKVASLKDVNSSNNFNTNQEVAKVEEIPKPILVSSSSITIETKNNINYIKNGVMTFGKETIVAEEMIFDKANLKLTSNHATIKSKNGLSITGDNLKMDFKKGTYTITKAIKSSPYVVNRPPILPVSVAYSLVSNLKNGKDSLRFNNVLDNMLIVRGKVELNFDGYLLSAKLMNVDKWSNLITAHLATLTSPDGTSLSGDEIVFDVTNKSAKATKAKGYYKSN